MSEGAQQGAQSDAEPSRISIEEANREFVAGLIRAREKMGFKRRVEMARAMNQLTGDEGPDESAWNRWEEFDRRAPGWALVVASRLSGLTPNELLQPEQEMQRRLELLEQRVEKNERLDRLEGQVAEMVGEMAKLVEEQRRRQRDQETGLG